MALYNQTEIQDKVCLITVATLIWHVSSLQVGINIGTRDIDNFNQLVFHL